MKKLLARLASGMFAFLLVLSVSACSSGKSAAESSKTAEQVVNELKDAGLPIDNIIVYDEESDVNNLLGRPNQYVSKANFADTTVEQGEDKANPTGGTIETFANEKDLKARKDYVEEVTKASPVLTQYHYVNGNYYLRIDGSVTPENAKKYEEAFTKIK